MNKSTCFSISYNATDSEYSKHSMDAKQLVKSISAIAEMIEQADKLLNGEHSTVKVMVTAPAKQGSLCVDFETIQCVQGAIDVVRTLGLSSAVSFFTGGSAIAIAKHMQKKKVVELTENINDNITTLTFSDDEQLQCTPDVAKLVLHPSIRQAMHDLISTPLEGKKDPVFKIKTKDGDIQINEDESKNFQPIPKGTLSKKEIEDKEANISFSQVNFEGSTGWKMIYHGESVSIKMEDEAFLGTVKANQTKFSKDEMFSVKLNITRTKTARSSSIKYIVKKVLRHRVAADKKILTD